VPFDCGDGEELGELSVSMQGEYGRKEGGNKDEGR
jgi:hypothetical protein